MGTTDNPEGTPITAYCVNRPDRGVPKLYCDSFDKLLACLEGDLKDLNAEQFGTVIIEAYKTTQEQFDTIPEFEE